MKAWDAMGTMLKQGRSFSGHERNCCFLNLGDGRFADVSSATQFDLDCDGRGLAAVDWDHDGDLDYWLSSRTGPVVRYLQNQLASNAHFLNVRLEGRSCNRDAIGARLELYVPSRPLPWAIQTLKAGEGYLAQSSKCLHFGLGDQTTIDRVVVHWPGGQREVFEQIDVDSRCLLIQGTGKAETSTSPPRNINLPQQQTIAKAVDHAVRVVAHGPLPLPPPTYEPFVGAETEFVWPEKSVLVNLWATWCQPCLAELREFERQKQKLASIDLEVLALCVDETGERPSDNRSAANAASLLKKIAPSFAGGMATTSTVDLLDTVRRTLTSSETDLPLPCSFLVNGQGQVVAIYQGPVTVKMLVHDVKSLAGTEGYPRERAIPFPGRWFTQPFPSDVTAIPDHMIRHEKANSADAYLEFFAALPEGSPERLGEMMRGRLGAINGDLGRHFIGIQESQNAIAAMKRALAYSPADLVSRATLAGLLQEEGQVREAITHHRELLRAKPDNPVAANNVAWGLATLADSTSEEIEEAVRLAESVCQQTRFQLPAAIDTLGVCYAASGRFSEAIATTERAEAMTRNRGKSNKADEMLERIRLYRQGQRYHAKE